MSFCCPPMKWRIVRADAALRRGIVEDRPAGLVLERQVDVPALARPIPRPLRHEGRHEAAALGQHLGEGLEQHRLVGGAERLVDADRGLEHARPGLGVETLERHVHRPAGVEELAVELGMDRGAQDRVAEEPRRHRLQVAVALLAHRVRASRRRGRTRIRAPTGPRSPFRRPWRGRAAGARAGRSSRPPRQARTGRTACRSRTAAPGRCRAGCGRLRPDRPCASRCI